MTKRKHRCVDLGGGVSALADPAMSEESREAIRRVAEAARATMGDPSTARCATASGRLHKRWSLYIIARVRPAPELRDLMPDLEPEHAVTMVDGSPLYTGIAIDVERRLAQHNAGRGAKFTRGRGPWAVFYSEVVGNLRQAMTREHQVKRMSRAKKLSLVAFG